MVNKILSEFFISNDEKTIVLFEYWYSHNFKRTDLTTDKTLKLLIMLPNTS
jgi:hypothetical protein